MLLQQLEFLTIMIFKVESEQPVSPGDHIVEFVLSNGAIRIEMKSSEMLLKLLAFLSLSWFAFQPVGHPSQLMQIFDEPVHFLFVHNDDLVGGAVGLGLVGFVFGM